MEGFEGMPKGELGDTGAQESGPSFSRAPLELSGKNAAPQTIRTFQSDLADTIKNGEGSLVKIAMAEHNKLELERENIDPNATRNKLYVVGGAVLVAIAVFVIGYVIYQKIPKTVPVTQTPTGIPTVVTVDSSQGINITGLSGAALSSELGRDASTATPTLNTVLRLIPFTLAENSTQHVVTTGEFFTSLGSTIPQDLLRSLDPTFTLGVHAYDGNGVFLVFKTNSYNTAFAGMLSWEQDLFDEMYKIFDVPTAGDNTVLFNQSFKDRTIKNQDARAILDAKGNVVFFYTFLGADKTTLLITDKEGTLTEVVNRLTANTIAH